MKDIPSVACLQLSYGRPKLSVEAVESFLRQTYDNKKLIIINSHHSSVYFDNVYENIKVVNIQPMEYLSDIYKFGMEMIDTDYFCIWDDDDLFMPWHIKDRMDVVIDNPIFNAVGHEYCLYSEFNSIKSLSKNLFASQFLYKNKLHKISGGIKPWDIEWWGYNWNRKLLGYPCRPSYIYRWATGENHVSGYAGEAGQHEIYEINKKTKKEIDFDYPWEPKWERDYDKEVNEFLEKIEN